MGTTQRINPGVTNQPNWGDLSNSITQIAKTIEQENKLDEDDNERDNTKKEDKPDLVDVDNSKHYKKISDRRELNTLGQHSKIW